MAYSGNMILQDYTIENGLWKLHFVAETPPPGGQSDVYIEISETLIPTNITQANLRTEIIKRLGYKLNQTYTPLNTFLANGGTVTL